MDDEIQVELVCEGDLNFWSPGGKRVTEMTVPLGHYLQMPDEVTSRCVARFVYDCGSCGMKHELKSFEAITAVMYGVCVAQ